MKTELRTEQLKALMALCRLTQNDLAKLMNCSEPMIQKVIANPSRCPFMAQDIYDLLSRMAAQNGYKLVAA